jgi:hypothetical protein
MRVQKYENKIEKVPNRPKMTVRIGWCRLLFKRRLLLKKSWRFFKKTTLLLEGRGHTLLQRPFRMNQYLQPTLGTRASSPATLAGEGARVPRQSSEITVII